jgi:FAD/FMN-containing dehydrogenase
MPRMVARRSQTTRHDDPPIHDIAGLTRSSAGRIVERSTIRGSQQEAVVSPRGQATATLAAGRRIDADRLAALRTAFDGEIIGPDDAAYDDRRQVWNAMIDRRPALIVRPAGSVDVATAVRFARDEGLEIAVKGGGHGPAGLATVDDGLMIDLGSMRAVRVDPVAGRAWVQGGALLVDVDRETSRHGVAVPAGVAWDTGIGGLTLGGGYGWLGRQHGLTSDNLVSAELVTAAGEVVTVSESTDPELFWGLRGGSGNFGIVTWFEFRTHAVPSVVHSTDVAFSIRHARALVEAFRDAALSSPRTSTWYFGMLEAGRMPGLPEDMVGQPVVLAGLVAVDASADLDALVRPLTDVAEPLASVPWRGSFRELQRISSEPPGTRRRRYWKAYVVPEISDGVVEAMVGEIEATGHLDAERELFQLGGAIGDLSADATAYPHRDAEFDVLSIGYWDDPAEDESRIPALRACADRFAPHASGVYVNNLLDEGEDRVRAAYREDRFQRLRELKTRMDPDNIFHRNANIPPLS